MIGTMFTHEMQPYGSVRFTVEDVRPDVQPHYSGPFAGELKGVPAWRVTGRVVDSSYCGALLSGVPVGKPRAYQAAGTAYSILVDDNQLRWQRKIDVAM